MFKKDSLPLGMLYGCIAPAIAWVVFGYILHDEVVLLDKPAMPYLVAIGLNLLLLRYVFKKDAGKTANGIMIVTFTFMLLVFMFKMHIR